MIPTVEDLEAEPLVHRFGDLFNPPALTNFRGTAQAAVDITAIRSLSFPPFSCSDAFPPINWNDSLTGGLFVDDRYFLASGDAVTFLWRPDRVTRTVEHRGLLLESVTVLPAGRMAALVRLRVTNRDGAHRRVRLRFGIKSTVTMTVNGWDQAVGPAEHDNEITIDRDRVALMCSARHSAAVSLQGVTPRGSSVDSKGIDLEREIAPGASCEVYYINVIDDDGQDARRVYDEIAADPSSEIARVREEWNGVLADVFTPGNARFSGSLPRLETSNRSLQQLYYQGVLALLCVKRDSADPRRGRIYTTLMPRYWQTITWPWDTQLGSIAHVLLDPVVATRTLEHWMSTEIHQFMGTDWLSGAGVGDAYSVNDFAVTRIAYDYVRWSGDAAWLEREIVVPDGRTQRVIDRLHSYARNWEKLKSGIALADYGGRANLLECVASYTHEVAGLNAANVLNLRTTAALLELGERGEQAVRLRRDADHIVAEVLKLYIDGEGCWHARHPGGRLVPVRHAFDLLSVLNTIPEALSAKQRSEMVRFFTEELQTPMWMHAMSPRDADVMFDVRPDHQWTGAYVAWPAETATGLLRIGETELVARWVNGLARTARQGPFGQAHFAETVVAGDGGGARKAPSDFPFLTDWACAAGAAWARLVLEGVFGLDATLSSGLRSTPRLDAFDADARLLDIAYQGQLYTADRNSVIGTGGGP